MVRVQQIKPRHRRVGQVKLRILGLPRIDHPQLPAPRDRTACSVDGPRLGYWRIRSAEPLQFRRKELGFKPAQWKTGLLVAEIGNTYAGSALIGLSAVLDEARPGQRIAPLRVSHGWRSRCRKALTDISSALSP